MTYSDKLKDPRWQKKRLKILERDGWKCVVCTNDKNTLHVHHLRYQGNPWDCPDKYLITLCERCHGSEESIGRGNPVLKELAEKINKPCLEIFDRMVLICYLYGCDKKAYSKIAKVIKGRGKDVNFDIEWH